MKQTRLMKIISLVLCAMMVLALLPQPALATEPETPSGSSGSDTSATPTPISTDSTNSGTPAPTESIPPVAGSSTDGSATPTPSIAPDPSVSPDTSVSPDVSVSPVVPVVNEYTVTFVINGTTDDDLTTIVKEGGMVGQPDDPAVPDLPEFSGMIFLYWAGEDGAYDFNSAVTDNLTLNAVFGVDESLDLRVGAMTMAIAPATYAVSYANGGGTDTVTDMPADESAVVSGATYTISSSVPQRTGYAFVNWTTSNVTGSAQTYAPGASFTMPENSVTLTAAWRTYNVVRIHIYRGSGDTDPVQNYTMSDVSAGNLSAYLSLDDLALVNRLQKDTSYALAGFTTYIEQKDLVKNGKVDLIASSTEPNTYDVYIHINGKDIYTITYILNGGINNPSNPEFYRKNNSTITLSAPTKAGYNFSSWLPSNSIPAGSTGDKTFEASWGSAIVYTIQYNLDGGANNSSNPASYTVESPTITLQDPTKTGYTFAGWTEGNTIPTGSTGAKTFTATWTPITYNITYILLGGVNDSANPATYTAESGLITLNNPTKAGYGFTGWTGGNAIPAGSTGDKTFTANWSEPLVYTIHYNLDGGSNNGANPLSYTVVTPTITLLDPTKTGYTFAGWTEGNTIPTGSTGEKTFNATWSLATYNITYNLNDGTNDDANPDTYTVLSGLITLNNPTKEGYDFLRWDEGNTIPAGSTGDKTFTAIWSAALEYGITYELNGGVNDSANPAKYTIESGLITLNNPTKDGYDFLRWDEGNTIPAGSTGAKTFTAIWSDPIEYKITYNLNDGTNDDANPDTYTVLSGLITLNNPTKEGYDFLRWDEGNTIPAGSTGDKTFTAIWSEPLVYNITYNLNDGTNDDANPDTYTVLSGLITLNNPTKEGYDFLRWDEGNTIPAGSTGAKTFTAIWSDPIEYKITYNLNDGTNDDANPETYTVESGLITLNNPTKDGYDFLRWDEGNTIPAGSTGDKTFTAIWSAALVYGITYELNGGVNDGDNPATYTVESGLIMLKDPTKLGYAFEGWTPVNYIAAGSTGAKTFEATWSEAIVYDITYNLNHGTNSLLNPETYTVNSPTIQLADPTRPGYYFTGWSPTDSIPTGSTENQTFTASWEQKTALTLTANNATVTYSGIEQNVSGFTSDIDGLTFENVSTGAKGTNAGEYTANFVNQSSLVIKDGTGTDVTERYDVTFVPGKLTINKAELTVTAGDRSMTYGKTSTLTPAASVVYSGFVNGETLSSAHVTGTVAYAYYSDTTQVTISNTLPAGLYAIRPGIGALSADNYSFVSADGTLTVSPATGLTVLVSGISRSYDGNSYSVTASSNKTGTTLLYSTEGGTDLSKYSATKPMVKNVSESKRIYVAAVNPNYVTAFGSGGVTITPRQITLTSGSASKTYDGTPLTKTAVTQSGTFATGEGFAETVVASGTITNAGSTANIIVLPELKSNTLPENYNFRTVAGTLTVRKAVLTATAGNRSMVYGQLDTLSPAETVVYSGFVNGETADTVTISGSVTYDYYYSIIAVTVDETLPVASYSIHPDISGLSAQNYSFAPANGTLTVTKSDRLTVSAESYTGKYDGSLHFLNPIPSVTTGTLIFYSLTGGTYPGDYKIMPAFALNVSDSKTVYLAAVNPNYETAYTSATLTILKRDITLTSGSDSKMYDGTALTKPGVTIDGDDFVRYQGFRSDPTATGTITSVGSKPNTINVPSFNALTNAGNYNIIKNEGTLTITASDALQANATPYSGIYDGSEHTIGASANITTGTELRYNTTGGTDLTTYSTAKPTVKNVDDNKTIYVAAVNPNYVTSFASATVTLSKRSITLTSESASKEYDGTELTRTIVTLSGDDFAPGEGFVATPVASGSVTDVDSKTNTIDIPALKTGTLAGNYDISKSEGTLTVTPSDALQAIATPYTGIYNGSEHTIGASANITAGTELRYNTTGGTDLTTYSTAKPTVKNVDDNKTIYVAAVNPNYITSFASAAVTLSKRNITLTSESASKEYDGTELTRTTVTPSGDDFAPGEGFVSTPVASGSVTDVGSKTNTIDIPALLDGTLAGNYTITKSEGTLTITASDDLTVDVTGYTGLYDRITRQVTATPSVESEATVLLYSTVGGTDLNQYSDVNPAIKNVADSKTVYVAAVNPNYVTAFGSAAITLSRRLVTLTSSDGSKDYDGLPLTDATIVPGGDGFAPDEGFETPAAASGTITDPGTATNTIVVPALNQMTLADNYTIQTNEGTLTVRPRVTYDANTTDVVTGIPATVWADYLGSITIADANGIARKGYVLTGWQDRGTGEIIPLSTVISPINRNYDLLAVWAFDVFDTTFDANSPDADVTNMPASILNKAYTSTVTLPAQEPARPGYNFMGWRTYDIDGTMQTLAAGDSFKVPANDVTFMAVWQIIISPVIYTANGGVGATYTEGYYPTYDDVTVAGNQFTRAGYRFLGWGTGANSGVVYTAGDVFVMPAATVTLYAQWDQLLYTVSYFVTGGTQAGLDGATPYATYTNLPLGAQMPVPDDPSEDGYEFQGWTSIIPATVPEGGITIYGAMVATSRVLENITDAPAPLAAPAVTWSVFNLIMTIATAIASGVMIGGLLKKNDDQPGGKTKKRAVIRFSTLAPAVGAILAFILTQNLASQAAMFDKWSIMMGGIGAVQAVLTALGVKFKPMV